jgi:hypothetical protein
MVSDPNSSEDRVVLTPTEARAGRIVKRGVMVRVLVISLVVAVAAMFAAYLLLAPSG